MMKKSLLKIIFLILKFFFQDFLPNLVTGENLGYTYSARSIFDTSVSGQPMKVENTDVIFGKMVACLKRAKKLLNLIQSTPGFKLCAAAWDLEQYQTDVGYIDIFIVRQRVYNNPERAHLARNYRKNFVEGLFFADEGMIQNEARYLKNVLTKVFLENAAFQEAINKTLIIFSSMCRGAWDLPAVQADHMMRENKFGYDDFHTQALITLVDMPIWDNFRCFHLFSHINMTRLVNELHFED